MNAPSKQRRERAKWLNTMAVRTFSAQRRPKWTAAQVFRGAFTRNSIGDAMSNLAIASHDVQNLDVAAPFQPNPHRKGPPRPADAPERIALTAPSHEITDVDQIGDSLQWLADRGECVSIYPAGAAEPLLARILWVHPEEPRFMIDLNEGGVMPMGRCTFVGMLQSARFQFELSADWQPEPGHPTFVPAQFPQRALVLNRRSTTRLEIPLAGTFSASFVLFGTPYELQLYDVSAGGVGMRCSPREATGLHIGRKLQRVRLELGQDTVVICDLEIRLSRRFRSFLLGEQLQIGCQFIDLPPQMQKEIDRVLQRMSVARR
ncbi:hypothetical protein GCM10007388_32920 [Pseudoduganella plicata]|uniref:PilZ domain-containing protein n=2 Tax=Pseudoduganella plicata TaxID=321984 RepID=A0AA87Y4J8_9BURK|nr:hypothetical protein GCM10007388_32920 [Pseudoduganella plicata]